MDEELEISLDEKTVNCDNCKSKIAEIAIIGTTSNIMKYRFLCPVCSNKTFIIKCIGKASVCIPDEYNLLDVEYNPESNLQYFKLGKRNG